MKGRVCTEKRPLSMTERSIHSKTIIIAKEKTEDTLSITKRIYTPFNVAHKFKSYDIENTFFLVSYQIKKNRVEKSKRILRLYK